jgi:hypothetical protein
MRCEYDMIEDVRVVKTSKFFNRRVLNIFIAIMLFLIGCGLSFRTTYLYAVQQIEMKQKEEDEVMKNKKDLSSKTYYIEQKMRKDLEKMLEQGK